MCLVDPQIRPVCPFKVVVFFNDLSATLENLLSCDAFLQSFAYVCVYTHKALRARLTDRCHRVQGFNKHVG